MATKKVKKEDILSKIENKKLRTKIDVLEDRMYDYSLEIDKLKGSVLGLVTLLEQANVVARLEKSESRLESLEKRMGYSNANEGTKETTTEETREP